MSRTRSFAALAAMWSAAALTVPQVAGATADEVGLSLDGMGYTAVLTQPLFDPGLVWAPGEPRTARLWVRNRSDEAAVLAIDVTSSDTGGLLATGAVVIGGSAGGAPMRAITTAGTHRLVSGVPVAAGRSIAVDLTIGLAADAPNSAQSLSFTFEVAATLTSADVPVDPPEGLATTTTAPTTTGPTTTAANGAQPPQPSTTIRPLPPTTGGRPTPQVPATGLRHVPALLAAAGFLVTLGALAGCAARRGGADA